MKAAVLYTPGPAENLLLEERPTPEPGPGQVLVRVKAFGLNRSELMTRKGLSPSVQLPRVLGIECVGEVVLDPSGQYAPGQQVAALMGGMGRDFDGSYADYSMLPKGLLHPIRSTLPWEMLGALPEMFQTVDGSLRLALDVQPSETLLIRGGTSSIGMLAAQVAHRQGLTVVATTRNAQKQAALLANGATHVVLDDGALREHVRALFPQGVYKALELVGAGTLPDTLACVRPGGTVCMSGMLAENWSIPNFAPMEVIPATVRLTIYDSGQVTSPTQALQAFIEAVEAGRIKVSVSRVFALAEIQQAHAFMESNQGAGKIVVLP